MFPIYNLAIQSLAVALFPYFLFRVMTERKHRAGLWQRLGFIPSRISRRRTGKPVVWVHSVSVGEVLAAAPLIARIRRQLPAYQLLLSATTVTGHGVCTKKVAVPGDLVIYFPLDVPFAVRRVMRLFSPCVVLLMEAEIWPNVVREASRRRTKLLLANGRLSDKSFKRYLRVKWFTREVLRRFSFIGMQTEQGKERMLELGAPPGVVQVTGSMKYEAALSSVPSHQEVEDVRRELAIPDRGVIVAGSTHRGEEQLIARAYVELRRRYPDLFLVLAPRHPERFQEVEGIFRQMGISYYLRSSGRGRNRGRRAMVLNSMGELMKFYGLASVAFVGKSITQKGGQNPLEPAACAKPVVFGPHMENFREAADTLLAEGGAVEVSSYPQLVSAFDYLLGDEGAAKEMGCRARRAVESRTGGLARTVARLRAILGDADL